MKMRSDLFLGFAISLLISVLVAQIILYGLSLLLCKCRASLHVYIVRSLEKIDGLDLGALNVLTCATTNRTRVMAVSITCS